MVSPSAHRSLCTAELKGKQNIILSGWRLLRLIRAIICNCRAEGTILPKDNVAQSPSEERTLKRKDQTHDHDTLSAVLKTSIEKTCFYLFFKKNKFKALFISLLPTSPPNLPLIHLQHHPAHAVPPHPVSKLGHASQPTAHTFLSSSSFWTLIHLWSDSVQFALRGIQDYCTY